MKTKLKIQFLIAAFLISYGLYNMFWFFVHSPILHPPFPFEHVQAEYVAKGSSHVQIGYMPLDEAYFHPYWLFWSLAMYSGFGYLAFLVMRLEKSYRDHAVKKSAKIAVITGGIGLGLFVGISFAVYSISELLPEPEPYLEAEYYKLKQIYKPAEPIEFQVHLHGYDYALSYLEIYIKDESGKMVWQDDDNELPFGKNVDGHYNVAKGVPGSDERPLLLEPGKYTIEASLSGHTIKKQFSVEI